MYYDLYLVCDSKVNSIAHARGSSLSQSDLRWADQVFELIWGNYARIFVSCFWTTTMIPHLYHFTCHRSCLHTKRCRLILLSRRVPLESSRSRHKFLRGTCPYLATMVATKKLQCWFHGWTSRQVVTHYPGTLLPPFYFHPQKSVKKIFPWYSGLSRGLILEILKTRTFLASRKTVTAITNLVVPLLRSFVRSLHWFFSAFIFYKMRFGVPISGLFYLLSFYP